MKNGEYISEQHTFSLDDFERQLNQNTSVTYQTELNENSKEVPIKQFFQYGKYFSCKFQYDPVDDKDELYAYYQDVE